MTTRQIHMQNTYINTRNIITFSLAAGLILASAVSVLSQDSTTRSATNNISALAFDREFSVRLERLENQNMQVLALIRPGTILAFAGETDNIPEAEGWMPCDGRPLPRLRYPKLFEAIGTMWGSHNEDTFNLPDLRGQFLRGVDAGRGTDPDKNRRLGTFQDWATGRPRTAFTASNDGGHNHGGGYKVISDGNSTPSGMDGTRGEINCKTSTAIPEGTAGKHNHKVEGGGDAETRPANMAVHFIIRVR